MTRRRLTSGERTGALGVTGPPLRTAREQVCARTRAHFGGIAGWADPGRELAEHAAAEAASDHSRAGAPGLAPAAHEADSP